MNKDIVVAELIKKLERSLEISHKGKKTANEDAIEAEGRMQTRYGSAKEESQLLEAAFAGRINKINAEIEILKRLSIQKKVSETITVCSLVTLEIAGINEVYLILPTGGYEVVLQDVSVIVVSTASPIARLLLGKKKESRLVLPSDEEATVMEIL